MLNDNYTLLPEDEAKKRGWEPSKPKELKSKVINCPVCDGSKVVEIEAPIGLGVMLQKCKRCSGMGEVIVYG